MKLGFTSIYNSIVTEFYGEPEAKSLYKVYLSTSFDNEGSASYTFCLRPREVGGALRVVEIMPYGISSLFDTKGLEGFIVGRGVDGIIINYQSGFSDGESVELSGTVDDHIQNNYHFITPNSDFVLYSGLADILEDITKIKKPCDMLWQEFGFPSKPLLHIEYDFVTTGYKTIYRNDFLTLMPQDRTPGITVKLWRNADPTVLRVDYLYSGHKRERELYDKKDRTKASRLLNEFFNIMKAHY